MTVSGAGKRLPGTPHPHRYFEATSGVSIAADEWGPADGPLVLLQHGGGQTRHAWKSAGMTLGQAGYHALALDARGHGDSSWAPDGFYGQDTMVADLCTVVEQLGNRRPVLMGASMGGSVSLVAIGENHIDATALVLVDIAHRIEKEGFQKIQAFMDQKPEGFASLDEVADAIASYQPHRKRPDNLDGLAKNVRLAGDGRYRWHWDPRFRSGGSFDTDKREQRLEACARNLALPTLLVRGGLSDVLSEEGARSFLDVCPHSEYVNVASAGHMVAGDRNDVFASSCIDFLTRVVPVDGQPQHASQALHPHHEGPPEDVDDVP
ncbi:MAG: alpha/beta hydrolase [Pseudomonadales bacterium]|jgi:non-heme chloroperoxidase|nr:alpha/beta hydrolase [Pseudomonadales bacterium]MDP6469788.1 alpha/beta hydrolase [Pseudomonadales bacterium]MDP6827609.1 alpha/beta hydrolase [Pseudomonadales bacterium]MDP6972432.1 alpha/beta hydrolase [Pseudomonadales bacterium]